MKTLEEIKKELEKQFNHRLQLRKERKMKNCCRNCVFHRDLEIDLGDLGKQVRYICSKDKPQVKKDCSFFKCSQTEKNIEEEMLEDLKNPSICGAKEPKIAALLWVLHENPIEESSEKKKEQHTESKKEGGLSWLGKLFK